MDKRQTERLVERNSNDSPFFSRSNEFRSETMLRSIPSKSALAGEVTVPIGLDNSDWGAARDSDGVVYSELDYTINEILCRYLNLVLTLCLFPFFIPMLGFIYIFHKALNGFGSDFFYRGERLGRGKKTFMIYKIRTLKPDSEQLLGGKLHQAGNGMEVKGGGFLRASRLDELPQLINVLRGDMDLVGPRPLRPAVYAANRAQLPDYDQRFKVRPGLTGISQLLTPHSTPKRIRSYIDNQYVRTKNPAWDAVFVVRTIAMFIVNLIAQTRVTVGNKFEALVKGQKISDRRKTNRLSKSNLNCQLRLIGNSRPHCHECTVVNANQLKLRLQTDCKLEKDDELVIDVEQPQGRNGKVKRMRLKGTVVQIRNGKPSLPADYILKYHPASDLDKYLVDKYFLKTSIA